jgi:anti-anti-sigma factor
LATDLRARLERALTTDSADPLLVDLEDVTFMEASGVEVLRAALKKARACGAVLRLVAPSAPVERVLRPTHTEGVLPIERDLITAYARVAEASADREKTTGFDDAA